jgi:hypothetical protein
MKHRLLKKWTLCLLEFEQFKRKLTAISAVLHKEYFLMIKNTEKFIDLFTSLSQLNALVLIFSIPLCTGKHIMLFITVKHNTEIDYPDYRMSLLNIYFWQHVSAVKRPSSGLYRVSRVKYNGLGTLWDPIVFTIILQ